MYNRPASSRATASSSGSRARVILPTPSLTAHRRYAAQRPRQTKRLRTAVSLVGGPPSRNTILRARRKIEVCFVRTTRRPPYREKERTSNLRERDLSFRNGDGLPLYSSASRTWTTPGYPPLLRGEEASEGTTPCGKSVERAKIFDNRDARRDRREAKRKAPRYLLRADRQSVRIVPAATVPATLYLSAVLRQWLLSVSVCRRRPLQVPALCTPAAWRRLAPGPATGPAVVGRDRPPPRPEERARGLSWPHLSLRVHRRPPSGRPGPHERSFRLDVEVCAALGPCACDSESSRRSPLSKRPTLSLVTPSFFRPRRRRQIDERHIQRALRRTRRPAGAFRSTVFHFRRRRELVPSARLVKRQTDISTPGR